MTRFRHIEEDRIAVIFDDHEVQVRISESSDGKPFLELLPVRCSLIGDSAGLYFVEPDEDHDTVPAKVSAGRSGLFCECCGASGVMRLIERHDTHGNGWMICDECHEMWMLLNDLIYLGPLTPSNRAVRSRQAFATDATFALMNSGAIFGEPFGKGPSDHPADEPLPCMACGGTSPGDGECRCYV
jgi:hypothetical protein